MMEHDFNPNYHSPADLLSDLRPDLYTAVTKASLATIAILSLGPDPVQGVEAFDVGDGSSVELAVGGRLDHLISWLHDRLRNSKRGVLRLSSCPASPATTSCTIGGLIGDSTVYFVARALDDDGYRSWMAPEVSTTPRVAPAAPEGVAATPVNQGVRVDWLPNQELDFAGYRVLRRINDDAALDTLTTSIITDTTFMDQPLSGANRYYYGVEALDVSGNGGILSSEAYGRPITLDQGILIVDETKIRRAIR